MTTTAIDTVQILENRLQTSQSRGEYTTGAEWVDTDFTDLKDFVSEAQGNLPGFEICPDAEIPTIWVGGAQSDLVYRWPDEIHGEVIWHYTLIRLVEGRIELPQ